MASDESCAHIGAITSVRQPKIRQCDECVKIGAGWVYLRTCQECGVPAIIVGWQTRITAFLLAGFSLLTALIFHANVADQIETIMFLKDISITGGFLLLVANGAGPLSLDRRLAKVTTQG
jgi:hypothetical protein